MEGGLHMRIAKLDESLEHKLLAVTIYSLEGKKLISEGTILSVNIIDGLLKRGIQTVYIEDENLDVKLRVTLNSVKRATMIVKLQKIYAGILKNEFNPLELTKFIRLELLPEIKNEPVSLPFTDVMKKDDLAQHSLNVAILTVRTARLLGLDKNKIELVAFVSLMHDIGKLIKSKNTNLKDTPHYEVAYEFMKRKNCLITSYMSVKFQSETYDGKGAYKIDQAKQLEVVKILSICNFYETKLRSSNMMPYECFELTQALVNIKFDPIIFKAFRNALYIYPIGLHVRLNNKAEGVIVKQNQSYPLRPIVKIADSYWNLMVDLSLFIEKVAI